MSNGPTASIRKKDFRCGRRGVTSCRTCHASRWPYHHGSLNAGLWVLCQINWRQAGASAPSILWMITPANVSGNWLTPPSQASVWRAFLDVLGNQHGLPREIVLDNGPELTSKAMFLWSQRTGVKLNFIQPGKPVQNAFCESFNGTFRDNCLNQHWFMSLKEARSVINEWRRHYNEERPHSSLGYQPPATFAKLQARRFQSPQEESRLLPLTCL